MMRKRSSVLFAVVLTMVLNMGLAWGADYPSKPINFLIPFGAGGSADLMGRALANGAGKILGQPVVPINKPGAGGGIMYTALKDAAPDGYTLGWNSTSILTTTNIGNVPFKYDAFDNICNIGFTAMPIAVRADAPWKTFQEFVDYGKKNPNKIKIGNAGTGSGTHLTAVLMATVVDMQAVHVPLGAGRRIASLLGKEVEAICVPLPEIAPQVQAGQARILAMSTEQRDPSLKDIPTMKELGYPAVMELFRGISAPKGTPAAVVKKLEAAFQKGAETPEFMELSKKNGFNINFMGKAEFEKYLVIQNNNVAEAVKVGGLSK
ncbi:MAG: tripartite tricarboxylate transporter substrate binding protein [Desulfobacterales bacterium]|nr:tripartite tricarboxylate transporter substrate binding protein [Desulfobacterales bacterium]